jgi:hypothetical protein
LHSADLLASSCPALTVAGLAVSGLVVAYVLQEMQKAQGVKDKVAMQEEEERQRVEQKEEIVGKETSNRQQSLAPCVTVFP